MRRGGKVDSSDQEASGVGMRDTVVRGNTDAGDKEDTASEGVLETLEIGRTRVQNVVTKIRGWIPWE